MNIQKIKLKKMHLAEYNPRIHNEAFLKNLKKSMDTYGYVEPIVWNKKTGNVVGGHARLKVLEDEGIEEIDVVVVELSDIDEKALNIALNKVSGEWDDVMLSPLIEELQDHGIDLETLGFNVPEIEELLAPDTPDITEDDYEIPEEPSNERNIARGDIYALGEHRLMCGDAISGGDVDKLMDGKRASISFTSPPYNVGALEVKGQPGTDKKYTEYSDQKGEVDYLEFISSSLSNMIQNSEEVLLNIGLVEGNKRAIVRLLFENLDTFKDILYWKKDTVAPHIQPGIINNVVEFILCFGDGKRSFKNAQFSQGTYWNVIEGKNASSNEYASQHKATFPLYLPAEIIRSFSPPGSIILEPFIGTGTTIIACEQLKRKCYAMDISPTYCNLSIDRWESLTGKQATKLD